MNRLLRQYDYKLYDQKYLYLDKVYKYNNIT